MKIIGITGGIASGKSLVSDLLGIYGCHIIDLDVISREVVLPGTEGLNELIEVFGDSIVSVSYTHLRAHET